MYEKVSYPRPKLDKALAGRAFVIDELACTSAAKILRTYALPTNERSCAAEKSQFLFRLCLAAICHQINWDFLSDRLRIAFEKEAASATWLSGVTARDVQHWLEGYHKPDRIRAGERALLLRNIGEILVSEYGGDTDELVSASRGRLSGAGGLLDRLDSFVAFREDPLRKKSNVMIHDIVRENVAHFSDESAILPAIDYHIIRLYLRTGRVVAIHQATMDLLQQDSVPRPRLVRLLREAVSEALSLTSLYAQLSIPEVNGIEWQIGRDICERDQPRCLGPQKVELGATFAKSPKCPNVSFCQAFSNSAWRVLREPDTKTRFY
jgi:hypothetical protein